MIAVGDKEVKDIYVGERKVLKVYNGSTLLWSASRLPSGYTELEWIKGDGSAYIALGISATNNTEVEIAMTPSVSVINGYRMFFGWLGASSTRSYTIAFSGTTKARCRFGNFAQYEIYCIADFNTEDKFTLKVNSTAYYLNGEVRASIGYTESFNSDILYLGRTNGSSTSGLPSKIYSCTIRESSTLVRDFIPCKSPSGKYGMYDLVEGKFYGNANSSGAFTGSDA